MPMYEGKPVRFIEYSTGTPDHTQSQMYRHFWDVFRGNGGGGSVTTPMIMIDEFQFFTGQDQQFSRIYPQAIDRAQRRRAGAHIDAAWQQSGEDVVVQARIINKLGETLGSGNSAQLHAIVWLEQKRYDSPHAVVKDASGGLCAEIEDGGMATCQITIPGVGNASGPNTHVLLALDYRPSGAPQGVVWDMIQTADASMGELPPPPVTNQPPQVFQPIEDVRVEQDSEPTVIDLSSVFVDPDDDNSSIVKTILTNTWPGLVTPTIEGNTLTLTYAPGMSGDAEITVRGSSNGGHADDTFQVLVEPTPEDQPPVVANPIADQTVEQGSAPLILDLSQVFDDPDNDNAEIALEVIGNSNTDLVTAELEGKVLTLGFSENGFGNASITVRATSNGLSVEDSFAVTVLPTERPPSIYLPLGLRGSSLR